MALTLLGSIRKNSMKGSYLNNDLNDRWVPDVIKEGKAISTEKEWFL